MAEEAKNKEEGEQPVAVVAPVKKRPTLLIVCGIFALILLIGAPVGYFVFKAKPTEELSVDAAHASGAALAPEGGGEEDALQEGEEVLGAIFPLDTFVVNLTGGKFIRIQVQLEFVDREIPKMFYSRLVPLRDAVITLLSTKTEGDVANQQGRDALRNQLREVINEMMRKEEIKRVYFTQFVVQ